MFPKKKNKIDDEFYLFSQSEVWLCKKTKKRDDMINCVLNKEKTKKLKSKNNKISIYGHIFY